MVVQRSLLWRISLYLCPVALMDLPLSLCPVESGQSFARSRKHDKTTNGLIEPVDRFEEDVARLMKALLEISARQSVEIGLSGDPRRFDDNEKVVITIDALQRGALLTCAGGVLRRGGDWLLSPH